MRSAGRGYGARRSELVRHGISPVGEWMVLLRMPDGAVGKDRHHLTPAAVPSWAGRWSSAQTQPRARESGITPPSLAFGQAPE